MLARVPAAAHARSGTMQVPQIDGSSAVFLRVQVLQQPRKLLYPQRPCTVHPWHLQAPSDDEVRRPWPTLSEPSHTAMARPSQRAHCSALRARAFRARRCAPITCAHQRHRVVAGGQMLQLNMLAAGSAVLGPCPRSRWHGRVRLARHQRRSNVPRVRPA